MTSDCGIICKNGYVAVHVLHWRDSSASFLFDTQNMKVKASGFFGLIDVSSKLQFNHLVSAKDQQ